VESQKIIMKYEGKIPIIIEKQESNQILNIFGTDKVREPDLVKFKFFQIGFSFPRSFRFNSFN